MDFSQLTAPNARVAIIATLPLTDNEPWITLPPGSLWMFHDGEAVAHLATKPSPVKSLSGS